MLPSHVTAMAPPCISAGLCSGKEHVVCCCRSDSRASTESSRTSYDSGYDGSYTELPLEKSKTESLHYSYVIDDGDDDSRNSSPESSPFYYNVIKHLGSGSFGEVHLITNPLNRKDVAACRIAMKRINLSRLNERQREEVEYEVKLQETLTKTGNCHIVHCYGARNDVVLNEKHIFLEYVDGRDLFEIAMNKGGVGQMAARSYFRQLLLGLSFLHDLYVAHRDIKPENLLIDNSGTLKIADFGLADCYRESEDEPDRRLSRICGSYEYLSPQVLNNDYSGPKNDVWAAGCVLIVMLTGDLAWDRADSSDPYYSLWSEGMLPPLLKDFDRSTISFLEDVLEIDENRRFSARQLLKHNWLNTPTKRRSHVDVGIEKRPRKQH